jgi:hypothetical protein
MTSIPAASIARASAFRIVGERERQLLAAAIVGVEQRVDHRHRAGQRVLGGPRRLRAQERRVGGEDRLAADDRADDDRHRGVVAVADPHDFLVVEVDAVQAFDAASSRNGGASARRR